MPEAGGDTRQYITAEQAQLGERVTNLGRRQSDLENEMRSGFRQMEQSFAAFTNETRASISSLGTTLAERSKPQWQALSVMLAFALAVGALAYWPIREALSEVKTDQRYLEQNALSVAAFAEVNRYRDQQFAEFKNTYENNRVVSRNEYIDKFGAINARLEKIDAETVPRAEHDRTWANYDQRFADVQRQVDEMKAQQVNVYNQRDVIRDILERLDRAEARNRAALSPG